MDIIFLILVIFAFVALVLLPTRARNRQIRQMQTMQSGLEIGTEVMTSSGLYGRVVALWADEVDLEVAPGVVTTWARLAVRELKSPSRTPVEADEPADESAGDVPGEDAV